MLDSLLSPCPGQFHPTLEGKTRGAIVKWLQTLSALDGTGTLFGYLQDYEVVEWLKSHTTYSLLYEIEIYLTEINHENHN